MARQPASLARDHGGGGLYIAPVAVVSLNAFTVNHTKRNKASKPGIDIHGSCMPIP